MEIRRDDYCGLDDYLENVAAARAAVEMAEAYLRDIVRECLNRGIDYDAMAPALGMTPTAAWERFSSPIL